MYGQSFNPWSLASILITFPWIVLYPVYLLLTPAQLATFVLFVSPYFGSAATHMLNSCN